ncbi:MAG: hypothetical protein KIIPBIDF_01791 [Candidatus Methanoperedenaceae archaeon GB50]|nr:MAG: hypothetical protein KIIPBIDF_01791 [Candidatus Methanoperedenaceae archaeon GB50]
MAGSHYCSEQSNFLKPDQGEAYKILGIIYKKLDKLTKATGQFKRALEFEKFPEGKAEFF